VEWFHSLLREGKIYGTIGLIGGIVWVAGYSARVDERWNQTEWMGPAGDHPEVVLSQLEPGYFDTVDGVGGDDQ
jgi:hypothetical protein